MDSLPPAIEPAALWSPRLPGWALSRRGGVHEADATFAAGIALKSLDDLIRADPPWLGCWRDRLALKSATVAAQMVGRSEDEHALRDALLLTATGDDPGPAGKLFLAMRMVSHRPNTLGSPLIKELAALLGSAGTMVLPQSGPDRFGDPVRPRGALRRGGSDSSDLRSPPGRRGAGLGPGRHHTGAKAELGETRAAAFDRALRPGFPDDQWARPRSPGRVGVPKAICLALADGVDAALRSAWISIAGRTAAGGGAEAADKRRRGRDPQIAERGCRTGRGAGSGLSRWAATRLFERLESFDAVRELSGRSSFRMFGL